MGKVVPRNQDLNSLEALTPAPTQTLPCPPLGKHSDPLSFHQGLQESPGLVWLPTPPGRQIYGRQKFLPSQFAGDFPYGTGPCKALIITLAYLCVCSCACHVEVRGQLVAACPGAIRLGDVASRVQGSSNMHQGPGSAGCQPPSHVFSYYFLFGNIPISTLNSTCKVLLLVFFFFKKGKALLFSTK